MRVKEFYLMQDHKALEDMQAELSRLQDQWDGEDGSPEVDQEYIDKWQDEKNTDDLSPF